MKNKNALKILLATVLTATFAVVVTSNITHADNQNTSSAPTTKVDNQKINYVDNPDNVLTQSTINQINEFNKRSNQAKLYVFTTNTVESKDAKRYLSNKLKDVAAKDNANGLGIVGYLVNTKNGEQEIIAGANTLKVKDPNKLTKMSNVKTPIANKEYNSVVLNMITNIQDNVIIKDTNTKTVNVALTAQEKQQIKHEKFMDRLYVSIVMLGVAFMIWACVELHMSSRYDYYY